MASAHVSEVSDASFQNDVLDSELPVVVDFWAEWCAPCRAISPLIEQLAAQYDGKVRVAKVNIDHNRGIASKYRIQSIPTLMVFKGGEVAHQLIGAHPQKIQELFVNAGG